MPIRNLSWCKFFMFQVVTTRQPAGYPVWGMGNTLSGYVYVGP